MRNRFLLLFIFIVSSCSILLGQSLDEIQILSALDADNGDELGISVAISGNFAVVGAWREDDDLMGIDSLGAVYIFERNLMGVWTEVQKIVASDREPEDEFGGSVAIDGNILVVGAHSKDIVSTNPDAGAAYVFERDASGIWNEVEILVASDRAEYDQFGTSVSISGETIVIGAPFEDQNTMNMDTKPDAGSAYIFKKDASGNWVETQKIVALDRATADLFATDVSIWDSTIIIGAYKDDLAATQIDAGSAYFFQQNINGNFIETSKVTASDIEASDYFGYAVDIFDNRAVIGAYFEDEDVMNNNTFAEAGSAYVFEKSSSGFWNQKQKIVPTDREPGDYFGYDVSISGNMILVGAPLEDEDITGTIFKNSSGSAYSFERDSLGDWNQLPKMTASDRGFFHFFGTAVDISTDYALIGAPFNDLNPQDDDDAGKAYIFHGECLENLIVGLESVPSRLFKANNTMETLGNVNVFSAETALFQAGTSITLTAGFTAHCGSDFRAYIDDCTTLPFVAPVSSETIFEEKRKTIQNSSLKVFPNPNQGSMSIQFNIAEEKSTRIDLFHSSGKLIKTIFIGNKKGNHQLEIEESLAAGVYIVRMISDKKQEIQKVLVLEN